MLAVVAMVAVAVAAAAALLLLLLLPLPLERPLQEPQCLPLLPWRPP
jgi:hypothetical protein